MQSPLHASAFGAVAYTVWQPLLLLMRLGSHAPLGLTSLALWTRFELTEWALGSFVGTIFFYCQRWRPRSWHRDWAQAALPSFALSAAISAKTLPIMSEPRWVASVLLAGAVAGAVFASITRGVRRLTGMRRSNPEDDALDSPPD